MRPEKKILWNLGWKKPEVKEILAMTLPRFFIEKLATMQNKKLKNFLIILKKQLIHKGYDHEENSQNNFYL